MSGAALEVDRLAKLFGGLAAVDGVSIAVAAGERRVLMLNYMTGAESHSRELKRHRFSAKVKGLKKLLGL